MHLIVHPLFVHQLDEPPLTLACTFHSFPFELLRLIALQLEECKDVCNFGLVNKECREAVADDLLWRHLCQRHFSVPDYAAPESWKELYKFNHSLFRELFLQGCRDQVNAHLAGPVQVPTAAFGF